MVDTHLIPYGMYESTVCTVYSMHTNTGTVNDISLMIHIVSQRKTPSASYNMDRDWIHSADYTLLNWRPLIVVTAVFCSIWEIATGPSDRD